MTVWIGIRFPFPAFMPTTIWKNDRAVDMADRARGRYAGWMIGAAKKEFMMARRVGHLATADAAGHPHVVPVCYAITDEAAYITIDEKPKNSDIARMKRLRNIAENPSVALVVDRYDEDWSRLGWVMLRGKAEILQTGVEHVAAQALLRERYPQYRVMQLEGLPVIAIRIARVASWGALGPDLPKPDVP